MVKHASEAAMAAKNPAKADMPTAIHEHPALRLQRTIGNRATAAIIQRKCSSCEEERNGPVLQRQCASCKSGAQCEECSKEQAPLQPKLIVNEPGDRYEQEADRIADYVMQSSEAQPQLHSIPVTPMIRRQAIGGQTGTGSFTAVEAALSSASQPLDPANRAFFESRFGYDFGNVRIHADSRAAESAQSVDALAYTVGADIVFGAGKYAPSTMRGQRLLAHELTHVAQQGPRARTHHAVIQRDEDKSKASTGSKCPSPAPGTAQKLKVESSRNGEPCACLIVIHNNERNAREMAKLMHDHCSYNLALLDPDDKCRRIMLPRHTSDVDPNELFPPEIAEQCTNDRKACEDFVKDKSGTTKKAEVEKAVQMQFFLAISDCSNNFTLPVIALHNNDVSETAAYRSKATKPDDVKDLELDVDKKSKETGDDQIKKMKEELKKLVGPTETGEMTKGGKTNIFRWCVSDELTRCHIGDPQHPDNVTWVTNEKDFDTLSKKKVNVALQAPPVKGGESETDLSTLFITLKKVLTEKSAKVLESLDKDIQADEDALDKLILELEKLDKTNDLTLSDRLKGLLDKLILLLKILLKKLLRLLAQGAAAQPPNLRFINIETPGERLGSQSDAERIRNYEAAVEVLSAVGLHCCPDTTKAEAAIKEGLKLDEKARKAKPKKTTPKKK